MTIKRERREIREESVFRARTRTELPRRVKRRSARHVARSWTSLKIFRKMPGRRSRRERLDIHRETSTFLTETRARNPGTSHSRFYRDLEVFKQSQLRKGKYRFIEEALQNFST